jgi:hypothetical protein
MVELTSNYIEDHMVTTHTPDSWARQVCVDVLSAAIYQLGNKSSREVEIDAKFTVSSVEPPEGVVRSTCIKVCVSVGNGPQKCVHITAWT